MTGTGAREQVMEVVSRKHASRSVAEMEGEIYSTNPRNNQVKELALHFNFIHPPPPAFYLVGGIFTDREEVGGV